MAVIEIKKLISSGCIFLLMIMFPVVLTAQENKLEIGVEGGPGRTEVIFSKQDPYPNNITRSSKTGFSSGISIQYNINHIFSIRSGASFENKGTTYEGIIYFVHLEKYDKFIAKSNFNYITVPFLFRATIGNRFRYFVNAGPYISLLQEAYIQYGPNMENRKVDATRDFSPFDYGLSAGIGVSRNISKQFSFSAEIRHNQGLTPINAEELYNNAENYTRATLFLIGVSYSMGNKGRNKIE